MFENDSVTVTKTQVFVALALMFFLVHIALAGREAYKCEQMLELEDAHDDAVKYSREMHPNLKYDFKQGCKIPMYGLEWVVEESEDYDD